MSDFDLESSTPQVGTTISEFSFYLDSGNRHLGWGRGQPSRKKVGRVEGGSWDSAVERPSPPLPDQKPPET